MLIHGPRQLVIQSFYVCLYKSNFSNFFNYAIDCHLKANFYETSVLYNVTFKIKHVCFLTLDLIFENVDEF